MHKCLRAVSFVLAMAALPDVCITVGDVTYTAQLQDNPASRRFVEMLPLPLEMRDLNDNEKYAYLEEGLRTDAEAVGAINSGDLMLFGSDCLVLFYQGFQTPYQYTRLGNIPNAEGLREALDGESVQVVFECSDSRE